MSRISSIITRVRDTLADPNGDRWSDERLLRLVDEAQKDICRRAKLLRTKTNIAIKNNIETIELPSDMLLLDRALFSGNILPLISHLELDRQSINWEDDRGSPKYLVYDKQSKFYAKLYPIPINLDLDTYLFNSPGYYESIPTEIPYLGIVTDISVSGATYIVDDFGVVTDISVSGATYIVDDFGVVTDITGELTADTDTDPDFGIIVGIEGLLQNIDYGILTSLSLNNQKETYSKENYGVTTYITESDSILTIYYLKKPSDITSIEDSLSIDDNYDSSIKYYVTGKSLRDDMDTQNRVVGNEELQFYDRELKEAINDDAMDFTRNNTQYSTNYRGAFDG